MTKFFLYSLLLMAPASLGAQTIADGYYRVQNQTSERFAQMVDNSGQSSYATSTFDLGAIHTVKPFDTIVDDPATIIYVEYAGTKLGNDFQYNLKAQGTSTWDIVQMNVALKAGGPPDNYLAYGTATKAGITLTAYLMDENFKGQEGIMSHTDNPNDKKGYCNWWVRPLSQDDERYFGLRPDLPYNGLNYMTFFASFPFDFYSSGMKAYKVTKVDGALAVYSEITGTVPAGTPVIVSCSSTAATSNRLSIVDKTTTAPSDNLLKGVYFCNTSVGIHNNVVVNDPNTMRVLGLTKAGKLGFIKSAETYMPRNRAYLQVPAGSPDELTLVPQSEYEEVRNKVTITAKNYSRLYGEDNPTFEYTVTDGSILSGAPTLTCEATKESPVGNYPIVVGKGTVSNTMPTFVNGQLTVTKAPLTITARSYTIKQNEALPTFAATYSGWRNSDTEAVLTSKPTLTSNAPADKKPGTYTITASGAEAANYAITYQSGTLTILEADPITVTVKDATMEYGSALPEFTCEVTGGTLSGTPKLVCEATPTSDVGTYAITADVTGIDYPNIKTVSGKLTINKAPLVITAKSYTIDEMAKQLPTFEAEYSGWKNGQNESVLSVKPTISCTATGVMAGQYDITVSGAEAKNYALSYVNGKLTITAVATITLKADAKQMAYGDAVPQLTFTAEGGTPAGQPVLTCAASSTSDVGEYDITIAQGTIDYPQHRLQLQGAKLTVTKAPVVVTATSYTIDETAKQLPAYAVTYAGLKNGQDESVLTVKPTVSCNATAVMAGEYDITVGGAEARNYAFSYVNGQLTITAVPNIIVKADAKQMVYGEDVPQLTYTLEGGSLQEGAPVLSCVADKTSDVGEYDIIIAQGTIDYPQHRLQLQGAKLTVTKAPVVVTANSYSILDSAKQLPDFEATYAGWKNGQDESVLTVKPIFSCEAQQTGIVAGEYTIVVSGAEAKNYAFTYVNGKLTIAAAPTVTLRAEPKQMTYGDAVPQLTYTVEGGTIEGTPVLSCDVTSTSAVGEYDITIAHGTIDYPHLQLVGAKLTVTKATLTAQAGFYTMKQNEERPVFQATYAGFRNDDTEEVITRQPTLTTNAPDDNKPGIYVVSIEGAEAQNYDFVYVPGQLVITDADAIVISVNKATKVYGDPMPAFTYTVSGGTVEGAPLITCEATESSPVGEYAIKVEKGSIGYPNLVFVDGVLTITKATLTVKADTLSRDWGEENPELLLSYEGFRCDDDESVLLSKPVATTTATIDSPVGEYPIVVSGGEAENYEIVRVDGVLKVLMPEAITGMTLTRPVDVYTTTGRKVRSQVTTLRGLPKGIYIVEGRKVILR